MAFKVVRTGSSASNSQQITVDAAFSPQSRRRAADTEEEDDQSEKKHRRCEKSGCSAMYPVCFASTSERSVPAVGQSGESARHGEGTVHADTSSCPFSSVSGVQRMATRRDGTTCPAESISVMSALTTTTEGRSERQTEAKKHRENLLGSYAASHLM